MRIAARERLSAEALLELINELSRERQDLRARKADRGALEQNRLEIVETQWELSRELIRRHLPAADRAAA